MRSIPKTTNSGIYPCTYTLNHHHLGMNDLCAGLSSLLCLCAADLLGGGSLDGLAGLADGGGAGNGVQFSRDPLNLRNVYSRKNEGQIANKVRQCNLPGTGACAGLEC